MSVNVAQILDHVCKSTNHFDTLGLTAQRETCTTADVTKAYRRLAARIHPDKCTDLRAKDAFDKINQASKVLGSEEVLKKLQAKFLRKDSGVSDGASEQARRDAIHTQYLRKQRERDERKEHREKEKENLKRQNEEIMLNQKKWKAHQQRSVYRQ